MELLKSNRTERDINIRNPEYVLCQVVEQTLNKICNFDNQSLSKEDLIKSFTGIINVIHQVQGKMEKISARNELFEHNYYMSLKK